MAASCRASGVKSVVVTPWEHKRSVKSTLLMKTANYIMDLHARSLLAYPVEGDLSIDQYKPLAFHLF